HTSRRNHVIPGNMRHKGFSLIELLVVVAIILVLVTIALPHFMTGRQAANEAAAAAAIKTLHTAEQQYYADNGRFAGSLEDLARTGAQYIGADLATGELSGYRFTVSAAAGGYVVHADPRVVQCDGKALLLFGPDDGDSRESRAGAGDGGEPAIQAVM